MNTTVAPELPGDLIRSLYELDRATGGRPVLPAGQRERAGAWLRRALVDFGSLEEHVGLLQELYGATVRLPRPRRDCWSAEQLREPAEPGNFRHSARLADERVAAVADEGPEALSDEELAALLLNPFALYDLFDVIDDLAPERWTGVMQEVGKELARRGGPPVLPQPARNGAARHGAGGSRAARWIGFGAALAACLLLGLGVGLWRGGKGGGHQVPDNLLASASRLGPDDLRGTGADPKDVVLQIKSTAKGFATLVLLFPDQRQFVVPGTGGKLIPVEPDQPTKTPALPAISRDATAALIVITEQPADGPVRRFLDEPAYHAGDIERLEADLRRHLESLNFRPIGFARLSLTPPAK